MVLDRVPVHIARRLQKRCGREFNHRSDLAEIDGHPSDPRWLQSSYMLGPLGIATIAALVSGNSLACDLAARELARPFTETANELFIGATGRLAAALFNAWSEKRRDVWLWDQIIYDRPTEPYIGPAHGFAGNIAMLLAASARRVSFAPFRAYRKASMPYLMSYC